MSEQQRIFATVAVCLGILIAWQFLVVKPENEKKPKAPTTAKATVDNNNSPSTTTPPTTPPPSAEARPPVEATPELVPEEKKAIDTPLFSAELSNLGASITRLELKGYNEKSEGQGPKKPVSLVTAERAGSPRQAWLDVTLNGKPAPALVWDSTAKEPTLVGRSTDGNTVEVKVTPRADAYALDYSLSVVNGTTAALPIAAKVILSLKPVVKQKSSFFAPPADMMNGLCAAASNVERKVAENLAKDGAYTHESATNWAGIDRQYFVVALVPTTSEAASCKMSSEEVKHPDGEIDHALHVDYGFVAESLAPGQVWSRTYTVYLGPKRTDKLLAVAPALGEVLDYVIWGIPLGFLARPMVFLMNTFHGWTSSWGVAIMMLTLIVKLLLFPVTYKSSLSMRKMQLLKPELDKLKKQFANDKERQQLEQMKLFKEKGVNPLGGCIPMLLQMPIWLALYRTLWSAVDLYQQSFLWVPDLTAKEPFPFMAIALGGLTFLQQKLQPTTMDSQQAKMMLYMMPPMMLFFMISLPSGLVLYILFNSVLTIFQQLAINRAKVTL
jgi:YidC/Oxa1 family membrane protein insertase